MEKTFGQSVDWSPLDTLDTTKVSNRTEAVRGRHIPWCYWMNEKAHGDVLNILLQIMEDGILTDGKGRTINLKKHTILVLTSNAGSRRI
jgi:ATP-dependent Clp protease ATP-binding subunit ClpA